MGKRQEAAKRTRENIVRAAQKLHAERGLSNVSVDEIVAEAGVSKGSFYVYFKRKEDIASEIAFEHFDELKAAVECSSGTTAQKLSRFLIDSVDYIAEQGLPLCQQWLKGAVCPAEYGDSGIKKLEYDREFILATLKGGAESGEIALQSPPEAVADQIVSEYYGMVALWSMTSGMFPMQQRMQLFAQTLSSLLQQGRKSEESRGICNTGQRH